MQPIIRAERLHYSYPGDEQETLHGIDLEIEEGSFVAVLGHNGSGKSTLAKLMNAILLPLSLIHISAVPPASPAAAPPSGASVQASEVPARAPEL